MNTVKPPGFVSSTASTSVSGSAVSIVREMSRVSAFSFSCVAAKRLLLSPCSWAVSGRPSQKMGAARPFLNCSKCGNRMVASTRLAPEATGRYVEGSDSLDVVSRVEDDRHRAVVDELDLHARAED